MQLQSTAKTFSVVLLNHGKNRQPVELESDTTFNTALDRARHFPLMTHEKVAVYRGAFSGDCAKEVYSRSGRAVVMA